MKFDLPPLSALPAFEAAARHESFSRAAAEMCITQAAVSFQVRNLEKTLGVTLFLRDHRTLKLTREGRDLFLAVQSAFKILESQKEHIARLKDSNMVAISAPVSFCSKWLVPRLPSLRESSPNIDLLIDATDNLADLTRGHIQLAIRYAASAPTEFHAVKIIEDIIFPVCSADLFNQNGAAPTLENLADFTLLSDQMSDFRWDDWLKAASGLDQFGGDEIRFSHTANAIDAAKAGQGIALGRLALVAGDLADGTLFRPFGEMQRSNFAYYLLRAPSSAALRQTSVVADWLALEAEQMLLQTSPTIP